MLTLYEAKMIHQFDHRWATYDGRRDAKGNPAARDVTDDEKSDPHFAALPRYWVPANGVARALPDVANRGWLLGRRDIDRSTDERPAIAPDFPVSGVGNKPRVAVIGSDSVGCCRVRCHRSPLTSQHKRRWRVRF